MLACSRVGYLRIHRDVEFLKMAELCSTLGLSGGGRAILSHSRSQRRSGDDSPLGFDAVIPTLYHIARY
eukprot:scaffold34607_cov177-Amphora_coffeaeformis.AAC.7